MNTILMQKKEAYQSFWNNGTPLIVNGLQTGIGFENGFIPAPGSLYYETDTYLQQLLEIRSKLHVRGDTLPFVDTDLGPGSLAVYLGSDPVREESTIWFRKTNKNIHSIEINRSFVSFWWERSLTTIRKAVEVLQGAFLVPLPDLVENWDVLASLIGTENLLMLMIESPDLVFERIMAINQAYFAAYDALYQITSSHNGGGAFHAFQLWSPGKVAKLQCDGSAMFSKPMFDEFVLPALTEQAKWLDNSIYHLDGTQAIHHLDSILKIKDLDVIEWTPQAGIEDGIHPRWYDMFRKILGSGKKLQVLVTEPTYIEQFCSEMGTRNIFFLCFLPDLQFCKVLDVVTKNS